MSLRDYQQKGVNEIRSHFARGTKKVLLYLATGGGKTVVFSHVLKGVNAKGNNGIMVVKGRQLVDQASKRLFREDVEHGVRMANHWNKNFLAPIQVCSIDTITSREDYPKADVIVIDEAHMATSPQFIEFLSHYPDAYILAVTATPFTRESLRHLADVVVHPISVKELMEQGYLVRPRYYAPIEPDLKGVRTVSGDYVNSMLSDRMSTLTGDIVKYWRELAEGRPTIGFAVNIDHSKSIVANLNAAGIRAEHIEGNNSFAQREAAIARLGRGDIDVLMNVGVLCTGVDIPFASCIMSCRPTQSYNLYIQQMGRGTRPDAVGFHDLTTAEERLAAIANSNKKDFIILDFAGNVLKHGFITEEQDVDLDGKKKLFTGTAPKRCAKCYLMYEEPFCPVCGPLEKPATEGESILVDENGELHEIKEGEMSFADEVVQFVKRMDDKRKKKGYKKGWLYYQVRDRYGEDVADELYPNHKKRHAFVPGGVDWFK